MPLGVVVSSGKFLPLRLFHGVYDRSQAHSLKNILIPSESIKGLNELPWSIYYADFPRTRIGVVHRNGIGSVKSAEIFTASDFPPGVFSICAECGGKPITQTPILQETPAEAVSRYFANESARERASNSLRKDIKRWIGGGCFETEFSGRVYRSRIGPSRRSLRIARPAPSRDEDFRNERRSVNHIMVHQICYVKRSHARLDSGHYGLRRTSLGCNELRKASE